VARVPTAEVLVRKGQDRRGRRGDRGRDGQYEEDQESAGEGRRSSPETQPKDQPERALAARNASEHAEEALTSARPPLLQLANLARFKLPRTSTSIAMAVEAAQEGNLERLMEEVPEV
jgi:hypothetical protein